MVFTKKTLLTIMLMLTVGHSFAQSFSEWFRQGSTQKKYLLQQIAALQVYTGYLRQGYGIAKEGWSGIGQFALREFGLHDDFFASLKSVNPAIRADKRTEAIVQHCEFAGAAAGRLQPLTYQSYVGSVRERIKAAAAQILADLKVILGPEIELTDEQRLDRLGKLYDQALDLSAFTRYFSDSLNQLNHAYESHL